MKPLLVALDLEFNQPSQRIIQIGAAIGDLRTGNILSRLSLYVNPLEALNPEISKLCGITPAALDNAGSLLDAYVQLKAWLEPFREERQLNPLTWGGGDSQQLREQLALQDESWPFGRRWVDVKTVFVALQHGRGLEGTGGLARSMKHMRRPFVGRPHDALDDAVNTFRMYCALLAEMSSSGPVELRP